MKQNLLKKYKIRPETGPTKKVSEIKPIEMGYKEISETESLIKKSLLITIFIIRD